MATKTLLKKVLLLALTVSALCSCADYSKIKFSDFRVNSVDSLRYSLTDMRGIVHSVLTVDNPYFAMTLKDFEAAVVAGAADGTDFRSRLPCGCTSAILFRCLPGGWMPSRIWARRDMW